MLYNMIDLLQKTAAPDISKQIRQSAQKALKDQVFVNPRSSLIQSAHIFTNQANPTNIRLNASALVLYYLRQKSQNTLAWDTLQPPQKVIFNEQILTSMIDQDKNIRRSAANIIAAICCIQTPRGGWVDVINNITSNTKNQEFNVKEVSFVTLGFICEGLSQNNYQININVQQSILAAILHGILNNSGPVVETAFKALRDGMKSFSEIFANPNNRQYLLKLIYQAFTSQYANLSLQCLIQYTKFNLNYITPDILQFLAEKVQPFLQRYKENQTCILAMEFWSSLIKNEELQVSFPKLKASDSTNKALQALIQVIYTSSTSSQQQEMINAAENAIYAIISEDFQAYQFYLQKIINQACTSPDATMRRAGIIIQAVFFISSPTNKKNQYRDTLLNNFSRMIMDNYYPIRRLAVHQFSKIAEESAEDLLNHPKFIDFLEFCLDKCCTDNSMMRSYSQILYYLADLDRPKIRVSFRKLFSFLLNLLAAQQKSVSFIKDSLCSLSNVLYMNCEIDVAFQSINYVRANFSLIQQLPQQRQQVYYQGLLTMAYSSLNALRAANAQIPQQIRVSLHQIIVRHFHKIKDVSSDGFYLMTAILQCTPSNDRSHQNFWEYIQFGLWKYEQAEIFKGVLNCICEFFLSYKGEGLRSKLQLVLQTLLRLFESDVARQLKLQILLTIGDLCLRCGPYCEPFLGNIIDFIRISMQGVVELTDFNYAEILQETVVETLTCIFHANFSIDAYKIISSFVESIVQFIAFSTDKKRRPKLSYLRDSISLLVDVIIQFPLIKQVISQVFVEEKINLLIKFGLEKEQIHQITFLRKQFGL